jgi:hypothetical protein
MFSPFALRNSYSSEMMFSNCLFIWIPNYDTNTAYWIDDPIKGTAAPTSMFDLSTASSRQQNVLFFDNVTFNIDPTQTVTYLINKTNKKVQSRGLNIVSGVKYLQNTGINVGSLNGSGTQYPISCVDKDYVSYKVVTTGTASTMYISYKYPFTTSVVATISASSTETSGILPINENVEAIILQSSFTNDYTGSVFCVL